MEWKKNTSPFTRTHDHLPFVPTGLWRSNITIAHCAAIAKAVTLSGSYFGCRREFATIATTATRAQQLQQDCTGLVGVWILQGLWVKFKMQSKGSFRNASKGTVNNCREHRLTNNLKLNKNERITFLMWRCIKEKDPISCKSLFFLFSRMSFKEL